MPSRIRCDSGFPLKSSRRDLRFCTSFCETGAVPMGKSGALVFIVDPDHTTEFPICVPDANTGFKELPVYCS